MKIPVYVLHGTWYDRCTDGHEVLGVSFDVTPLERRLDWIADSNAADFVELKGDIQSGRSERSYEATDPEWRYAKFYITEQEIEVPELIMRQVGMEMKKIDRSKDVGEYLQDLHDNGGVTPWVYEYMDGNEEVIDEVLRLLEKVQDCSTPFNTTMDIVVGDVITNIHLDDEKLEYLWEKFGGIPIDDDENILEDFLGFDLGTHREDVWRWFDEHHSKGVAYLMHGTDRR